MGDRRVQMDEFKSDKKPIFLKGKTVGRMEEKVEWKSSSELL